MATASVHSKPGGVNSQYRIRCNGSRISVGDEEFLSATEALEKYISQYDGDMLGSKYYSRTATDLLNPKSALHLTAERSLQTGIRDTEEELKLADVKDNMSESMIQMKKSVKLKADVEEALNKSQELMDKISTEEYPDKTNCPSDIGSLNTEALVNMNPVEGFKHTKLIPSWKSKHVFSYKTPRNRRAKTVGGVDIARDLEMLNKEQFQKDSSRLNVNANSSNRVTFQENCKAISPAKDVTGFDDDVSVLLSDSPNQSRLTARGNDRKLRERSRSVSPSILKRERKLFESGARSRPIPSNFQDFDNMDSSAHKTPSWIDSMDLSDVTENVWKQRDFTTSRPPPSWIQDIEGSDITSVGPVSKPAKKLQFHDLLRPLPVISNTQDSSMNSDNNDTLPPPGLTYNDLVGNSSRLNLQNTQQLTTTHNNELSLSSKLKDLQDKTNAALNRYHERMQQDECDSPSKGSNLYGTENPPRCSSLDTAALLAGVIPPGTSEITGASPIVAGGGDNDSLVTGVSSPGKQRRPHSPDTDIVLEGDRPWEKTSSFKNPVAVTGQKHKATEENATFSGGAQPGSLEALKNMIFKLQQEASITESDEEHSRALTEKVKKLRDEAADLGIGVGTTEKFTGDIPSLKGYNFQSEPGGQSLEKALVHLDRLKTLVNNTQKQREESRGGAGQSPMKTTPLCEGMEQNGN